MNIDNIKEVQAKSNKMISEIHFKEQCSWLRNSKKKKDLKNNFSKEIYEDEINYSVSFGDMTINSNTKFDYMCKGVYLWEEDSGELKDYIEKIISQHSEWKE